MKSALSKWLPLGLGHLLSIRRDPLAFYGQLQRERGDLVRLRMGPHLIWFVFDPVSIHALLTTHAGKVVRDPRVMRILRQWNGDSLLVNEGDIWRARRRKVLPAFKRQRLPIYARIIAERTTALSDRWKTKADNVGRLQLDTDAAMARLSLDIALTTLFAETSGVDVDALASTVQDLSQIAYAESTSPVMPPRWLAPRKRRAIAHIDAVIGAILARRANGDDDAQDHGDLLSMLLAHHGNDRRAVRDDAVTLLIAGHETSGALFSWLFASLAHDPAFLARLLEEIDSGDGAQSPLLGNAIAETLRLYPPAYALFPRQARTDIDLGAACICKGELIQILPCVTHRDPRWFTMPDAFRPERFAKVAAWPSGAYLPFGTGPRVCIGEHFALMETAVVAATLLRQWSPERIADIPLPEAKFSLRPAGGLPMFWTRRQHRR